MQKSTNEVPSVRQKGVVEWLWDPVASVARLPRLSIS